MQNKKFILLYGDIGSTPNQKSQNLIDGIYCCMYREFAAKYGCIIYMTPQDVKQSFELSIPKPEEVVKFCNERANHIVLAIKFAPDRDDQILSKLTNQIFYYSTTGKTNTSFNRFARVNLVDTEKRIISSSFKLFLKGKNPVIWKKRKDAKEFDYVLVGKRGDKNEVYFINEITKLVQNKRSIIWIGGADHRSKIHTSHHNIVTTEPMTAAYVPKCIPLAKIGICFTSIKDEGLPQTFLEMLMCGVPVVYNVRAPFNDSYYTAYMHICEKSDLISTAEFALSCWCDIAPNWCRQNAINQFSTDAMYERLCKYA